MRTRHLLISFMVFSATIFLARTSFADIQLTQIVSGLMSPVFVGNAGDGSNRLFIVEQGGIIKVLQPGAPAPTVFLDIHTLVKSGGEQGLLGLAFHPMYATNRRFFVYYSQNPDGTEVIAEYHTSAANPNLADPGETRLLTIPHPTNTNHNGGMLAFSPADHFLYIGVGDGGSGNDPPNNAQNINVLLGKLLRIDVDHTLGDKLYVSPAGNPFINVAGSDEIFAYGLRNPWRFSFDRQTFDQWVADVGQGAREEVDTPIVAGGNYGWRIYEGFNCTGNDPPSLCNPANYLFPIFDYGHLNGRCSITGGYVYRGQQGALPAGNYVYGDYCTGEILTRTGGAEAMLLDTTMNISSFGEDEQGELYVVNLGGTISRIDPIGGQCTFSINPTSASYTTAGGSGTTAVTAGAGCGWTAVANASWIHVTSGANGIGNDAVGYSVDANAGPARNGTMTIAGKTFTVSQDGVVTCTFSISPTRTTVTATGGPGTVNVTAPQGCAWTAVSNVSWISITGGASGNGNGAVTYSVETYTGKPKNRNGTLTIAGATFSVKQSK